MPRISQFYGIAVYMYYSDHAPPHFHAIYGEFEAVFEIATGAVLEGAMPRRATNLVVEWAKVHRAQLLLNWDLAREGQVIKAIDPLD